MAEVITVGSHESIEQVQARLAQVTSHEVVLHLRRSNPALRRQLALTLLQRTAEDLGLHLVLVARDPEVRRLAGLVGLEVQSRLAPQSDRDAMFKGLPAAPNFQGLRRRRPVPQATSDPVFQAHPPGSLVVPLLLAGILLLLGLGAGSLLLPQSTVILHPGHVLLEATAEIVADPRLVTVNRADRRIPARELEAIVQQRIEETVRGTVQVPDTPARGTVVFINQSEDAVEIPAGALVRPADQPEITFRTMEAVTVPAPAGSTVRVNVLATQPGPVGNVPAYAIDQLDLALGLPVAVANDQPLSGGTVRTVSVVTPEDRERIRSSALRRARERGMAQLKAQLRADEMLVEPAITEWVIQDTLTQQTAGDGEKIVAEVSLRLVGQAINHAQVRRWMVEALREKMPADHVLVEDSLVVQLDPPLVGDGGLIQLRGRAEAISRPQIREREVQELLQGRPVAEAIDTLMARYALTELPEIRLIHGWTGRLPWLPMRISVVIEE